MGGLVTEVERQYPKVWLITGSWRRGPHHRRGGAPAGREVHRKGIEPDLPVETPGQLLTPSEVATSKDLQYEKAVETLLQRVNS